jgi:dephospho-CoA kinase
MKRWIVTGGIGTGKSSFCQALKKGLPEGVALFSSDEAVHRAYESPEVRACIATALGLLKPDDDPAAFRKVVREAVVGVPAARKRLEAILHPFVWAAMEEAKQAAEQAGAKVLVAEVPLYYETGRAVVADKIVVLAASQAVQLNRVQTRRGVDEATALAMLKIQLPLSEKVALADMAVWNDGSVAALEQAAFTLLRQCATS